MLTNTQPYATHDNGPESNARFILFSPEEHLKLLAAADTLFNTAALLFKQIFKIKIQLGNSYITVVYNLLNKKSKQLNQELFQTIERCNELDLFLNISKVVSDFEDSICRATAAVSGCHIRHQGCFYLVMQAIWTKIQKRQLATFHIADPEFRLFCNTQDALAFLPADELQ